MESMKGKCNTGVLVGTHVCVCALQLVKINLCASVSSRTRRPVLHLVGIIAMNVRACKQSLESEVQHLHSSITLEHPGGLS